MLDVVFNEDGTAVDVSQMGNEITQVGTPKIVKSDKWGMNVMCTASSTMGKQQNNCFTVTLTDQIWDALKDGHTLEIFCRPFWEGALNKSGWGAVLSFQQTGGNGLMIYDGEWYFEPHVGGSYVSMYGGTPIGQKWAHVVGVWNKDESKCEFYVNGQLVASTDAAGELGYPNANFPFIGIGGDLSTAGHVEAGFPGDIAIARIYDKPLTESEVTALYTEIQNRNTGAEDHQEECKYPNLRYDEDGTVLIATGEELNSYALLTKESPATSARLENDIDYTQFNENISYYGSNAFRGIFDGNGHTVTVNFDFSGVETTGFIADAINGAVVKDLTIEGNVVADQRWCGILFGENYGATAQNITIRANLHSNYAGACYNGVLSGWDEKTCTYENILIESTISGSDATYMGALIGDVAGTTYLKNVLVVSNANVGDLEQNSPLVAKPRSGTNFENVYYVNQGDMTLSASGATELDIEDVANGAACFKLNKGQIINPTFYQNVKEDPMPTLDPSRGVVVKAGEQYITATSDAESMLETLSFVATNEADYAAQVEAYVGYKEELAAEVEKIKNVTSFEEFAEIYAKIQEIRTKIDQNLKAYEEFKAKAEEIGASLEGMTSQFALQLIEYLQDEIEPNDTYLNGSFVYIYENKTLDTEGVYAEIQNMEDLQKRITAADAPAGTDVTVLLNNPDFSNGFAGWEGDDLTGYGTNGKMWAAENWNKESFDIYQELSGLKNGIYALQIRGGYRPFNDQMASQYWPYIYANGNINYLQTLKEGMIAVEDAVDKENCYISAGADNILDLKIYDIDGNVIGYVLQGVQSCCYAFQAGRYENLILVNVTDGNLRVGVNHTYSQCGTNEWVGIGDVKLTYCGTVDEATESLDKTLAGMMQRVATIDAYEWSDAEDFGMYPNYAQALKDRMNVIKKKVAAKTIATAAEKYAWIEELSAIFSEMIVSKQDYRELAGTLNRANDRISDYPEHSEEIRQMVEAGWEEWRNGMFNGSAEVQAKINEINAQMDSYEITVPAAGILDIVFNADGSASDVSAMNNTVVSQGDVRVKQSPMLGTNVACLSHNDWAVGGEYAHYRVPSSETLENALADGVTMECFVRPTWEGDELPSDWASAFGFTEVGGMGLMVYNGMWTYEIRTDGSYRDAYAKNIPVVKDEWVHITGVWNKEEGTSYIYINGDFAGSVQAEGDLNMPNLDERFVAIGGDLTGWGEGMTQAAFQGDIAIARIYDEPLNPSQVNKLYKNVKSTFTAESEHDCNEEGNSISEALVNDTKRTQIYNIMGQKVSKMTKGLYIVNGKKVLVK